MTMDLKDTALPVRQDATLQLRPRLFLEGNLFVDLHPGSPGAPELHSGSVVPETQTSNSVQFDQVLTDLQAPVRKDLQIFLKEFGDGLDKYGGAKGFQESFRTSPAAYEYTSQVNQALLGTQPGDLAGFVSNLGVVARELNANSTALQGTDQQPQHRQRRLRGAPGLARGTRSSSCRACSRWAVRRCSS